ncbi:MAG: Pimeloyl-ACP methyl ester carboxylesterase [Promethearchaeota archaeon]|nr:MAG: Pimeloyl-ACP methyl ester carboxylesterase [Candidatus Lokiarchaeota archaeon]
MELKLEKIKFNYETIGEGTPVICLHGYFQDHKIMKGSLEPIFTQRKGYRRIYFDLPGMGKTSGYEWIESADDILDTIIEFIDEVVPEKNFILIGDSYGAYLARGILHKKWEQVDGICLISPVIIPEKEKRELPDHEIIFQDKTFLSTHNSSELSEFQQLMVIQNERTWNRFQDEIFTGIQLADPEFLKKVAENEYSFSFDVDKFKDTFENPSLFIVGRQDAYVGYRDAITILDNFPHATFTILDAAGHGVQIEQEKLFNNLMNNWLTRLEEIYN